MASRKLALPIKREDRKKSAYSLHHLLALCFIAALFCMPSNFSAQTGGEAGIQGTVSDSTGAAIPHAKVTATNDATGIALSREATGDGLYTISPILPGTYTVKVTADGFSDFIQKNLVANALVLTPLNISLKVGAAGTEVEVTAAPPQLETTNATIGLTVENETYSNLPLNLNGQQRDPTAVGNLAPGAASGTRLPVVGGTGNYLGQLYLDGLPATTISQQGDNRLVSQAVSVDSIDQLQVVTSTPPAEYSGAGAENFTMKSGSAKYHGSVKDFLRNTSLDAWQFSKGATKPIDHQNELSATFGGHVPGTKRIFFFFGYDRYHNRSQVSPTNYNIPTTQERTGDFTQLNCASTDTACISGGGYTGIAGDPSNRGANPAFLFDPTTTSCSGGNCTRQPFVGMKNGIPTYNVIPQNYISTISKNFQQYLPNPTNTTSLANNYAQATPKGFDNHLYNYRVDFQWTPKHRISTVGALGTVNYLNNFSAPYLPLPYVGGDYADIHPKVFDVQDAYTINNSMVNQVKFGFVRFFQNIYSATAGTQYGINNMGVTNLPGGQAGVSFPGISFAANTKFPTAVTTWTTNSSAAATQLTTPNNYAVVDNFQWVKGAHSLTFGITVQWQEINNANPATLTGLPLIAYDAYSTANFSGASLNATTGYAYASFLLGAVGSSAAPNSTTPQSLAISPVSEVGGRYRPIAPYAEDTWKVNSKLTIDAGLRWDYLPPYHEVKDRWSFLNPTATNAATGTPGALEFAGSYGGAGTSCNCRTPVQTYWKNWGPRVGLTFSPDDRTVFRIGAGRVFSQGGGVGGRGGAYQGTGQLGFNTTATAPTEITSGATAGPSYYLNNSSVLGANANTGFFANQPYPATPSFGTASTILDTGNYLSGGKFVSAAAAPGYADPYFSGRAPDFMFYNAGLQRAINADTTFSINYVGNQSHHLINSTNTGTGTPRGYWSNQLNPIYLAGLGGATGKSLTGGNVPLLTAPATAANVAIAQQAMAGISIPAYFQAAAAVNASATIAQGLTAFPQYSSVADTYGSNVGNFSYNSLQVTMQQRLAHGLTYNFNYTWAQNIGDDGPFRTGFDIPAAAISRSNGQSFHMNRIDRGPTTFDFHHTFHAFGVYSLPFGKGKLGGNSGPLVREIIGGWQLSGIWTYTSGSPVQLTYTGCSSPLQGQCMPDINPAFTSPARINGGYGQGPAGRTACSLGQGTGCTAVRYFDSNAFLAPVSVSPAGLAAVNLIGNAPRTAPFGLLNPPNQNVDTSLRKDFQIHERLKFTFEVDAFNTWNHVNFANVNAVYGSAAFGTIPGALSTYNPRSFEFAGHVTF